MSKPRLFLIRPGFADPSAGPGLYHCPHCARIEGLLNYHPQLRTALEVTHVDFPRPRPAIIDLIGEANQSCPAIVFDDPPPTSLDFVQQSPSGLYFATGADAISLYLAAAYDTSPPHP